MNYVTNQSIYAHSIKGTPNNSCHGNRKPRQIETKLD